MDMVQENNKRMVKKQRLATARRNNKKETRAMEERPLSKSDSHRGL